jgi:hypothetical protein
MEDKPLFLENGRRSQCFKGRQPYFFENTIQPQLL